MPEALESAIRVHRRENDRMVLFKKRTSFPQFIADLVSHQCDFLMANFSELTGLADKSQVLTKEDKEQFFHKAHALLMVDLAMSCSRHFSAHVSQEEVGEGVGYLYGRYLRESKQLPETEVDQKMEDVTRLLGFVDGAERDEHKRQEHYRSIGNTSFPKIEDAAKAYQLYLCQGFAEFCVGKAVEPDAWEGRRLVAFTLAMALVTNDIVGRAMQQYRVTF
jgi:hypothetical protein